MVDVQDRWTVTGAMRNVSIGSENGYKCETIRTDNVLIEESHSCGIVSGRAPEACLYM